MEIGISFSLFYGRPPHKELYHPICGGYHNNTDINSIFVRINFIYSNAYIPEFTPGLLSNSTVVYKYSLSLSQVNLLFLRKTFTSNSHIRITKIKCTINE